VAQLETNNYSVLKYEVKLSKKAKGSVVIIDNKQAILNIMRLGELSSREIQLLFRFGKLVRKNGEYHKISLYKPLKDKGKRREKLNDLMVNS
jgi:hypothetical protein